MEDKNNKIKKKNNFGTRVKNKFGNALRGIVTALREESSLIVYLIMIIISIGLGIWLQLSTIEWAIILLTIGIVTGFEFVNTSIENFVDLLSFEYNIKAKKIKDICAAASIINAIIAVAIGFLIYLQHFIDFILQLTS